METETHFEKNRLVVCCSADEIFNYVMKNESCELFNFANVIDHCTSIASKEAYFVSWSWSIMIKRWRNALWRRNVARNVITIWLQPEKYHQTKNHMIARLSSFCSCNWWHLQFHGNSTFYQRLSFIFGKSFCVPFSNRAATN